MTQDKYTTWKDLIERTAKFVSKDFPEVEYDDLVQDIVFYVLSNDKLVDPNLKGMSTALYRFAITKAWEYRKQGLYISPQYNYRTSDIRKILARLFDDQEGRWTYLPEDQESFYEDDRLVANSDISYAYSRLPEQYKAVIFRVHALKEDVASHKDRYYRAIARMADILNTYNKLWGHDGLGSRRSISNARAASIIDEQEKGRDLWT